MRGAFRWSPLNLLAHVALSWLFGRYVASFVGPAAFLWSLVAVLLLYRLWTDSINRRLDWSAPFD